MNKLAEVEVFRFNPGSDDEPRFQKYEVPFDKQTTVLETLQYIYENLDHSLAFRAACRAGYCSMCSLKVNGKTCLSCATQMSQKMKIEPMPGKKIIRDLVVEMDRRKKSSLKRKEKRNEYCTESFTLCNSL